MKSLMGPPTKPYFSNSTILVYGSEMSMGSRDNGANQWTGVCLLVSCGTPKPTVEKARPRGLPP